MARTKVGETARPAQDLLTDSDLEDTPPAADPVPAADPSPPETDSQTVDEIFGALKTLLSTVEKLQKARQDVGDLKPLVLRVLDGELVSEEELEQLKAGIGGLSRLVRLYTDYNTALAKAQPARNLLDQMLKP